MNDLEIKIITLNDIESINNKSIIDIKQQYIDRISDDDSN